MADPELTRPPDTADYERDQMKPGSPPRPASEPEGAESSTDTSKTLTDPGSGEPTEGRPQTTGV